MNLTIYSQDFDLGENVVNNGFTGKIFIENALSGNEFVSIYDALEYIVNNNVKIESVSYMYRRGTDQYQCALV